MAKLRGNLPRATIRGRPILFEAPPPELVLQRRRASAAVRRLPGKEWVPIAYARRPDELLAMGITGASSALAEESKTAPDCAKPLTARYVEKLLRKLGRFPKANRGWK